MENKGQKPTVDVERRRPGSSTPPAQRERAEAPNRQRERGSSGGPSGGTPGGSLPPGMGNLLRSPLGIVIVILLVVCGLPIYLLLGGKLSLNGTDGTNYQEEEATRPIVIEDVRPTSTRRPTATPAPAGASSGQTWTVLLYQDADDKILEQDIFVDLNEAERVGSGPNLNVVAQIDRYQAGFSGDGNWTGSRRYFVRQDNDLGAVGSDMVMDLGEANMADGDTLVDFAIWAIENYPADKYVLILSDHGMGWPGGWSDATATGRSGNLPLQTILGDNLYLNELDQALAKIIAQSGIVQFEMIGMDACLMGHIEVMSALAPHARYAVLSQETEPALGWAYAAFLGELSNNPGLGGAQLGQAIVDSYIVDDQRIVDDTARADLVGRGSPMGSLFGAASLPSAAQVARQMGQNITLTTVDLQALPELMSSLNELAVALQGDNQRNVAQARSYAQSFTNIFGKDVPPAYIDLGNFAELVARSGNGQVSDAVARLQAALQQVVIAEKHGARVAGATGVSIYFPNSQLYGSAAAGPESYTGIAERFASESLWDDFLAFHYTGETFDAQRGTVAIPPAGTALRSPAAGGIQVSAIGAPATEVTPGEEIRLTVDIEGENLGYVKLLVGYLDQSANSLYLADSDYLASPDTREAGGIYYPDWGVSSFTMAFNWEPIVYAIDDGTTRYPALFTPETYGASSEQAVYTVEGVYTFADSGDQLNARLYFANGVLQQVFGFTGQDAASAPREIMPQPGDTFTLLEKWMDLDDQGNVLQTVYQEGKTLTFSDRMFTWEVLDAAAGQYVVGFIIEDLDGNSQVVFTPVTVR
ncbi:MAG: hypothetical protein JW934_17565 [Anaerolineae bacterium]|nr:hypothetical protein [Anaerolineae bacterium]